LLDFIHGLLNNTKLSLHTSADDNTNSRTISDESTGEEVIFLVGNFGVFNVNGFSGLQNSFRFSGEVALLNSN